jgi:hypothetical protein
LPTALTTGWWSRWRARASRGPNVAATRSAETFVVYLTWADGAEEAFLVRSLTVARYMCQLWQCLGWRVRIRRLA